MQQNQTTDNGKRDDAQRVLLTGFEDYLDTFATITRRARRRFEQRDWRGMRLDTLERLDLYPKAVDKTQGRLMQCLDNHIHRADVWEKLKQRFAETVGHRCDAELACTFFNSVLRKVFGESGAETRLTFVNPCRPGPVSAKTMPQTFQSIKRRISADTIASLLKQYRFRSTFANLENEARISAAIIARHLDIDHTARHAAVRFEMLATPFFRGMSAYLIGQLHMAGHRHPLVFAIDNGPDGMHVDAILLTEDQTRILFSFSRAYFHVETVCPNALVHFLKRLMPGKRNAELYIGLGYHKHGKTELYRDLLQHQQVCSQELFDFSPGKRGMVMIAFNMPGDDLIYKIIRDRFDAPKQTTVKQVMDKYDYVFRHDRAGRLLDVQTFENLTLEDCCFTPELLTELDMGAKNATHINDGRVVFYHAYVERRVTPLDLFLQTASPAAARNAVIDYGQAIKDMAQMNVFPGDMLLKNFGVTSLGRVVFYDYDELCPLTECNFRRLPQARQHDDELSSEPWFMVGEHDVFPEEFSSFLGLAPDLRKIFLKYHGDLLDPAFWQKAQDQIRSGHWTHIRPYSASQRLNPDAAKA
jgi:isocitrate dehydrogenase kinase/phosphatase